jgi:hypothetical protein
MVHNNPIGWFLTLFEAPSKTYNGHLVEGSNWEASHWLFHVDYDVRALEHKLVHKEIVTKVREYCKEEMLASEEKWVNKIKRNLTRHVQLDKWTMKKKIGRGLDIPSIALRLVTHSTVQSKLKSLYLHKPIKLWFVESHLTFEVFDTFTSMHSFVAAQS